jgi:hypothetical protein
MSPVPTNFDSSAVHWQKEQLFGKSTYADADAWTSSVAVPPEKPIDPEAVLPLTLRMLAVLQTFVILLNRFD